MTFLPGLELCRRFFIDLVRPILAAGLPGLPYAAARLGAGSEVLGLDTPMSMDHDWGPHLLLFLRDDDIRLAERAHAVLRQELPTTFIGFPLRLPDVPSVDPRHDAVWVTTCRAYFWAQLRYDLDRPMSAADWLSIPAQRLLELTAGGVYHDGVGELSALRARLAYYPRDVWLYLMAAGWARIGQEEHLMPRAGFVGDELGSALIGSRLIHDVMQLGFLLERRYPPYPKWFGSAFALLPCAATLSPPLWRAQRAVTWQERAAALAEAYEALAALHNALGLTEPVAAQATPFHDRPFPVIHGERFAAALVATIESEEVRQIAARRLIGGIDQWSDSSDLRADIAWRPIIRQLYAVGEEAPG